MQVDTFAVEEFPNLNSYAGYSSNKKLRVCIATEEILGPVRNGGIASTYYHLAKGLAAHGHEVHILYLKGEVVENETPEHWVEHFAGFGVSLHYLSHTTETIIGPSQNWQRRYSGAYQWLAKQERFDVVHTSEWRGGLFYVLMVKKLGLSFQDTLFIVKTSSPHLWNRHYQMQPIAKKELLPASFAEQKCVEFGDMVIGGSAHLLCFMRHIGYQLPDATYVQPNILDFSEVHVEDQRPKRSSGDVVKSQELTFFGRLETRKGIELFCTALDLLKREGVSPQAVNFLGKYGQPLANQKNEKVADYIRRKAMDWDFDVSYFTDYNQPEALSYLCSRDMIAVMPSLIENSTMAVYEALENSIPFIATRVGGTAELIAEFDHSSSLVAPNAHELADSIKRALKDGQRIAQSSFDNKKNLEAWYGFHAYLAEQFSQKCEDEVVAEIAGKTLSGALKAANKKTPKLEVIVLLRGDNDEMAFAEALVSDPPDSVKLVITDPAFERSAHQFVEYLETISIKAKIRNYIGFPAGDAISRVMNKSDADACIVCDGTTTHFVSGFCSDLRLALKTSQQYLITSFVSLPDNKIVMPMGSDIVSEISIGNSVGANVVCIPRDLTAKIGKLLPYDLRYGLLNEYVLRASQQHGVDLMIIPECRLKSTSYLEELADAQRNANSTYLQSMPLIENENIAYRKFALLATSHSDSFGVPPELYRDKHREDEDTVWLLHADRHRKMNTPWPRVTIGLDEKKFRVLCIAKGHGERSVVVNGEKQSISLEQENGEISLHCFCIPDHWETGQRYNVKFTLTTAISSYSQVLRIIKLSHNVFIAVSGNPILDVFTIEEIFESTLNSSLWTGLHVSEDSFGNEDQSEPKSNFDNDLSREQVLFEHRKRSNLEKNSQRGRLLSIGRACRNLLRLFMGRVDNPIKASIPPRELLEISPDFIQGWAWDRKDKTKKLVVVLELNGEHVSETIAEQYTHRFGSRHAELAEHGFKIALPPESKKEGAEITVRVKEGGNIVQNGKLRYQSQMLVTM
ncbi:Glycogen synthase [Pseudovibrio axinellae]|uniref:Glycogen synthase n=1 Tax=Pseudovibrio axinellae TaxID=989403 RepID=A0A165T358_9HYPH|nr:glycosyltransferase family 4 protein [Pseudovibrio axinellae]KZL05359.1 Glycogen synthase [Pseudovibrio axinellae]SER36601.1 Glycosyltransferase involved in cell wall bisynthesis [Pseudovibrio axinellae]